MLPVESLHACRPRPLRGICFRRSVAFLRVMLPQEHVLLLLWDLVNRKWPTVQIIARVTVLGVTKHDINHGRDLCHFLQS
jgi:hypothetical protein